MFRRSSVAVPLVLALLAPLAIVQGAAAAAPPGVPIQVPPVSSDPTGPRGLAVLNATQTGTSVQVLVPGVAAGTTAVIHPGEPH